ncbi:hypothetical protein SAMN05421505_12058 [Sinosporangium album]|uniref:Uncharacterized protein n=1 Tax=Sinosporangium album TaxID=504805 RepID=A0A1G8EE10_9ACTN|nr:hypothetical protein [Sinosporangium album]SDH68108.1 hypothetical protein SAMN05421505_12058 [Sinosporangium album]
MSDRNDRDALALHLVGVASMLACTVRDDGPDAAAQILTDLTSEERDALPVVLAAMIPVDVPTLDLLAWHTHPETGPAQRLAKVRRLDRKTRRRPLAECGSHAAFNRHKARNEPPCEACEIAERVYQRTRKRASRKKAG